MEEPFLCQCPYPDCGEVAEYPAPQPHETGPVEAQQCRSCTRPFSPRSVVAVQKLLSAQLRHKMHRPIFDPSQAQAIEAQLCRNNSMDLDEADPEKDRLIVVLDNIRSLHNVGAIFRTADAAGFSRLYLCGMTGTPPRNEIAKVSLGAETWMPFSYQIFLPAAVMPLKKKGYQIVALEKCPSSKGLYESLQAGELQLPLALIVGNEVGGLSHEGVAMADHVCHLSMRGQKESLNVSVAFGVASYFLAEHLLRL